MSGEVKSGQKVHYGRRVFRNVLVTHVEVDVEDRGIDGHLLLGGERHLVYGRVTIPVDQQKFVVVQQGDHWVTVDTM